jgi:hypothetical protein
MTPSLAEFARLAQQIRRSHTLEQELRASTRLIDAVNAAVRAERARCLAIARRHAAVEGGPFSTAELIAAEIAETKETA